MEILLLGSLEIRDDDGEPRAISGTRLQILLTALALRCGEVASDDYLVDALWGVDIPRRSANALQRLVSTLRRTLAVRNVVERRAAGYVLAIDKSAVDIHRFDDLAAQGYEAMRAQQPERARELLDTALGLWRGNALADVAYEQFAQADIARLAEARLVATEVRIDADLALGRLSGLIGELEQLVLTYPLREHLHAQLMLALSRSGRPAEALRAYQSARTILNEELGLEPSAELRSLEEAILRQDDQVVRPAGEHVSAGARTNLRTPLTPLIGRQHDLTALRPVASGQRLVTFVGPGGVGKSRLALEAAREMFEAGAIDVWLVELADVADPNEVVPAIMAVLDISRTAGSATDAQRLTEFLKARRALVVLDNCEHLVASAARVAQELLESCPTLTIWTTSREGLAVTGEALWPVPPLGIEDSVALFVERGRAADPTSDFGVSQPGTPRTLEEICRRLDGLPLAIELAAARLRAMPITELATGLEDRFRILNRGARTALPRQQTLRAVVDWSYDLLFEDERRVFDRLSVFGGSCTMAAARAVCSDDEITADDVGELISRLADKSLVDVESDEVDGYTRCRTLQTLVDYGRERLESSGEAALLYAAHGRYYTDFAARSRIALRGDKQRGWLRAVTANLGNLRSSFEVALNDGDAEAANTIAGSLGWYWWFTGRAPEGARWLARARACPGPVDDLSRARVMAWTAFCGAPGFVRWTEPEDPLDRGGVPPRGRMPEAEIDNLCTDALGVYRDVGALAELPGVELALAVTYSTLGNYMRARELLTEAEQHLASETAPAGMAMHAFAAARLAFVEERFDDATAEFRNAVGLLRACRAEVHCSFALRYVGRLAALRADHATAIAAIEQALDLARGLGLAGFANVLLTDLGVSLCALGDFERARAVLAHPLTSARDVGSQPGISESLTALAMLEWRAGEHERAARLAGEGLDIARTVDDHLAAARCLAVLGFAAGRHGDIEEARSRFTESFQLAQSSREPRSAASAIEGLATLACVENDDHQLVRLLGAAHALRHAPGRATGPAFATSTPVDVEGLLAEATQRLGPDVASRDFADGAADPSAVVSGVSSPVPD
jgi:predicted ATPase